MIVQNPTMQFIFENIYSQMCSHIVHYVSAFFDSNIDYLEESESIDLF